MSDESKESDLLTCKELATSLRHHVSYVYAMRARGFKMPGGTATLEEAREWLQRFGPAKGGTVNGSKQK